MANVRILAVSLKLNKMQNTITVTAVHSVILVMNDSSMKKLNIVAENLTEALLCRLERDYPECDGVIF